MIIGELVVTQGVKYKDKHGVGVHREAMQRIEAESWKATRESCLTWGYIK